ncbi:poly polymerase 2 ADP-ribosyltransferase 2 [Cucurbitaria berberidis CBS 394.84]|uniref:Poly [ADP-ribose] polymerase n=1 Tax=Cucurbitaria berberidis CBS 394.84 TaxID=1168544 RepID=A0A9P4GE23_9PLEO|nr:poly polymerase 2 ADP-ribosyltransferase 2 [Cucurbitaria berberidis CBS 394.84]KAF1844248.1 poly polymerase 2 ADP-ribosyltransferase 2 [Cucurbitaria berberidis CBS 394.84]
MARKAAQKASQAPPLDGCSIATSGRFPGTTQAALQARVTSLGATVASSVTADTNFLIATEKDFESKSSKVKAAATHNVPVVTIAWLEDCESTGTKADETQHLLSSSATPAAAPAQKQSKGSKKRAASPDASPAPTQDKKPKIAENAKVGDGQNAKSKKITIAIDEYCPLGSYQVYIDGDGTIWDASLNQTNASANNNKFYKVQLLSNASGSDFKTWTRWGRVGERGQMAMLGGGSLSDAIKNFEKKFKDKSGLKWDDRGEDPKAGKYAYVERSYNPDSDEEDDNAGDDAVGGVKEEPKLEVAECTLDRPTQDLMQLIFNQQYFDATMTALNYDANKLPLGKLSKATIARGFQALKDMSTLLDNTDANSRAEVERLSNLYYSVIPHAFGRNRPPIIRDNDALKKEIELLESLSDMKEAAAMLKNNLKDDSGIHRLDKQFQGLGMNEMTALDHSSPEFTEIDAYLNDSKGATHYINYAVQDIFRIERQGEFDRFEKSPYAQIESNRRLLWHGSRVTNYGGILGQGLRIAPPEAPVSGYMFGKGIYLADMSSKSANYCCAYNSGGTALLLLCEAELGNPMHELTDSSYSAGEDAKAKGMYSTLGLGQTGPSKWKDASCVHPALEGCMMPDVSTPPGPTNVPDAYLMYNEYITYDVAQVRLRYLLRVRM